MTDEPKVPGRLWRAIDGGLFSLLNQRVALTLLALAAGEAISAPFLGVKLAIVSLATSAVAGGLILAGASLWLSSLGQAAAKISQAYERETTRSAETQQGKAAAAVGRIN